MSTKPKTVLITGASTGIGFALAYEFAQRGYKVYAGARSIEKMKPLEDVGVSTFHLDITSQGLIEKARDVIAAENDGELDILFNNAGMNNRKPVFDVDQEELKNIFDVNLFGHFAVIRAFQNLLLKSKGLVAFTASVIDLVPIPFGSVYTASKSAFDLLAKSFALEVNNLGIKVLIIKTGGIKSEIGNEGSLSPNSVFYLEDQNVLKGIEIPLTPAPDYAKQVVNDVESSIKKNTLYAVKYRGKNALTSYYLHLLLPFWIYQKIIIRVLGLTEIYKKLSAKNSKPKSS